MQYVPLFWSLLFSPRYILTVDVLNIMLFSVFYSMALILMTSDYQIKRRWICITKKKPLFTGIIYHNRQQNHAFWLAEFRIYS